MLAIKLPQPTLLYPGLGPAVNKMNNSRDTQFHNLLTCATVSCGYLLPTSEIIWTHYFSLNNPNQTSQQVVKLGMMPM